MATQTKTPTLAELPTESVVELGDSIVEAARRAGLAALDTQERTVKSVVDLQVKLVEQSGIEAAKAAVDAQVAFVKEINDTYVSAARELLS